MRYRIYFSVNGYDDSYIIEGDSVEEIYEASLQWLHSRGLTELNVTGSEELPCPY